LNRASREAIVLMARSARLHVPNSTRAHTASPPRGLEKPWTPRRAPSQIEQNTPGRREAQAFTGLRKKRRE
jgi:hypothetical protein